MPITPIDKHAIVSIVGEDGLALAAVVGELVKKIAAGMPEGYSIRFDVDRTDAYRDEIRVIVGARDRGDVEFILRHDGSEDVELWPVSFNPYVVL